jgi:hypothetical protein
MIIGADEFSSTITRRMGRLGSVLWRIGALPTLCVCVEANQNELVRVITLTECADNEQIAAALEAAAAAIRAGRVERSGTGGGT